MAYDIRLAKLITGDIILAKFQDDLYKDPAILQTIPTEAGVQMLLLPFGYPFEQEFGGELKAEHVLYQYKSCPEELKNKYLEATSNLTLATPGTLRNLSAMAGGAAGKMGGISGLIKK
ncbi:MAG: hypothetical protein LDL30_00365 [Desulfovibrio sp.]|nr:hypothetical protein [Desulfovibrio sp.]MCA1985134.1 hypothetical protein [Desulfovibrio sp.]